MSCDHSKNIQANKSKTSLALDNSKNYLGGTHTESIKIEFRQGAGNISVTSESFKKDLQKRSQIISQHPDLSHLDNDFISELPVYEEVVNTKVVANGKFSIQDRVDSQQPLSRRNMPPNLPKKMLTQQVIKNDAPN